MNSISQKEVTLQVSGSLNEKTTRALMWSFIESAGGQAIHFIISVVLARLLLPEQFGLIGMLAIFVAVAQTFLHSGFGAALIQKKNTTQADICSIFYFNIAVGVVVAALFWISAPLIADFYSQPILKNLTRFMALQLIINSFGLIQNTLLTKDINFKILTKTTLVGKLISGSIGITLAANGFGVWSLAIQQTASSLFETVFIWFFSSWRPSLVFSFTALKKMFRFGSRLLLSSLLNQIFTNIYTLVIGKFFSPADLGYYTRAKTLNDIPSHTLSNMVSRVMFPVFSTIQDDKKRVKRAMRRSLQMLAMVNTPLMIGISVIAEPLVIVVLSEKWLPCVPYLKLLCFLGIFYPLHLINLNVMQSLGRSDLFLRLEIIKKALIVINIVVTWRFGIIIMIWGMLANTVIAFFMHGFYSGSLIQYGSFEQIKDLAAYFLTAVAMGCCIYIIGLIDIPNIYLLLAIQISSGVMIQVILCYIMKLNAFLELVSYVKGRIPLKKIAFMKV